MGITLVMEREFDWPDASVMSTRLSEVTDQAEEILALLGWDTWLSGGLVLQTMLREKWPTDVDIYTTNPDVTRFAALGPLEVVDPETDEFGNDYRSLDGVKTVLSCRSSDGNCKIDVIVVTSQSAVFDAFDFDFCKCWFDGEQFMAEYPETVRSKTCITDRKGADLRNYEHRRAKYEERGFIIVDRDQPLPDDAIYVFDGSTESSE